MERPVITDLSLGDLKEWLASERFKPHALEQVVRWLYREGVESFGEMSNLSRKDRECLDAYFAPGSIRLEKRALSRDGTSLFLFALKDGQKIEAVYIPAESGRRTLCLSTQAGCAMACTFCRTGQMKLLRNLTQGEILEQVLHIRRAYPEEAINNLVFMGMGEPMANLKALLPALEILQHNHGFGFSRRRITVSTAGLVPKMFEFMENSSVKLAISLHAPNDALRNRMMPINERYPLAELLRFCKTYKDRSRDRITFEYVLLKGVNDDLGLVPELIALLKDIPSKINLIPFNPFDTVDYRPSDPETIAEWMRRLSLAGIQTNLRASRGLDILAACGQLAA